MDLESSSSTKESRTKFYGTTLCLAYQSLGVVYGDLSISPIYVYSNTFSGSLRPYREDHEILGVLSLVIWTLTLIPLLKYIVFVLGADDNGEGGTFALYSLLCRQSKMGLLKNYNAEHEFISGYDSGTSTNETVASVIIKEFFHKYESSRVVLLLVVLLGTSMVIGDGILTPTMSVLSAVYGVKIKVPDLHENYAVVVPACVIIIGLFALQHYGTQKVGFLFAPILTAWLLCIAGIGVYNILSWNPRVVRALSPFYIYDLFKKAGKDGWSALGGIVLSVTGAEAMFADLGHFSKLSIRIAFVGVVYPCLILSYMGEAAYLMQHKMELQSSFHKSIPEAIFWPVFIVATLATVVGSQAIISATFSIISQCRALSCFPRVKISHTSNHIHGQIYIPEVNWMLMVLCLAVVLGFRDTTMIGNAYGLAVITVMFVTTSLMFLIICTVWKKHVFFAFSFLLVFGFVELVYFSACLAKLHRGGWLPIVVSLIILSIMCSWHYGTAKKHGFEMQNKISLDKLLMLGPNLGFKRVPGIGLIYSNVSSGVPPMFGHFVTNFPAFHQTLIFVTLQSVMVPRVPVGERFVVVRFGPPQFSIFRCTARYGYKDVEDSFKFETQIIEKVADFLIRERTHEKTLQWHMQSTTLDARETCDEIDRGDGRDCVVGLRRKKEVEESRSSNEELRRLLEAKEGGIAYMMGNTYVVANKTSCFVKKFAIDVVYGFLRRNSRRPAIALGVPYTSLVEVGMVYHV